MKGLLMTLTTMLAGAGDNTSGSDLIGSDEVGKLWATISPIITTVVWIIVGVLVVVLLIKGITTALAVVKAADDPQARQEKLGSFKYMAIGLAIAIVVTAVMGTVLTIAGKSLGVAAK